MKAKFMVGDKVRIISSDSKYPDILNDVGETGEVQEVINPIEGKIGYFVRGWWYSEHNLERVRRDNFLAKMRNRMDEYFKEIGITSLRLEMETRKMVRAVSPNLNQVLQSKRDLEKANNRREVAERKSDKVREIAEELLGNAPSSIDPEIIAKLEEIIRITGYDGKPCLGG